MPLNEIPNHFDPETRNSIEAALEDAWQELSKDGNLEATLARKKLRTTMVALASVAKLTTTNSSGSLSMLGAG
jgi:hypothetical protein